MKILNRIKKEPSISCIRIDTHTQTHTKLCISKWNYGLSAINQFNSVHLAYNDRIWTFNFLFAVAVATATAVVDVSLSLTRSHVVAFVNNFAHNFAKIIDTYTVSSKNYRIWMRCTKITLIGALCLSHTIQPSFPSCPWTHRVLLMRFFFATDFCCRRRRRVCPCSNVSFSFTLIHILMLFLILILLLLCDIWLAPLCLLHFNHFAPSIHSSSHSLSRYSFVFFSFLFHWIIWT